MRRLFISLVLACACSPASPAVRPPEAMGSAPLEGERFLMADSIRARGAGASTHAVVAIDAAAPGDRVSGFLRPAPQDCTLLFARGSEALDDIDLFAFDDDGRLLGADERPGKTPSLLLCPPLPTRIYVSARVAAGYGIVALAASRVPSAARARVGSVLEIPGFVAQRPEQVSPRLDALVGEHRKRLGGRFREVRRGVLAVDPGAPSLLSFVIEPERCMDVWVQPAENVSHLDVALLDAEGRIRGRAVSQGKTRFIVACAGEKTAASVEVRPQNGSGASVVVLSESEPGDRRALDPELPVLDLTPTEVLDGARETLERSLEAQGYGRATTLQRSTALAVARRTGVELSLAAGCTRVDVIGGRPLSGVEAWLWRDDGLLLSHDRAGDRATLFGCGPAARARLDLEALASAGPVSVEARPLGSPAEALVREPVAAARLLATVLGRKTAPRVDQLGAPRTIELDASRREVFELSVPIARCNDVVVALGAGGTGVLARVIDRATDAEIDRAFGTHAAGARACALGRTTPLDVRVELSLASGRSNALVLTRLLSPKE